MHFEVFNDSRCQPSKMLSGRAPVDQTLMSGYRIHTLILNRWSVGTHTTKSAMMTKPVPALEVARGMAGIETDNEPKVLRRWNLFTIDTPLLWGQYWNTMDWLPIALVSALAVVTFVLCIVSSPSPKKKRHERGIVYQHDRYEIEPSDVPQFEPTWRNEPCESLSHKNPKGWSRS